MKRTIIAAHYNENIEWMTAIPEDVNVHLYTKSDIEIPKKISDLSNFKFYRLENIGNEGHTYLTHIVKNYESLEGLLYFIQADPHEHCTDFIQKLEENFIGGISDFNLITTVYGINSESYDKHINHKYDNIKPEDIKNKIFSDPWNDAEAADNINYVIDRLPDINKQKKNWIFNANGLYSVRSNVIKERNIEFYKMCLDMFSENESPSMLAFAFERIFPLIFKITKK